MRTDELFCRCAHQLHNVTVSKTSPRAGERERTRISLASSNHWLPLGPCVPLRELTPPDSQWPYPASSQPGRSQTPSPAVWIAWFFGESIVSGGARASGHGAGWPQAVEPHGPNGVGLPLRPRLQPRAQEEGDAGSIGGTQEVYPVHEPIHTISDTRLLMPPWLRTYVDKPEQGH